MHSLVRGTNSTARHARIRTLAALAAAYAAVAAATPVHAGDLSTSPGRASVYETRRFIGTPIGLASAAGHIVKAKPRHVLTITANAYTQLKLPGAQSVGFYVIVNGSYVEPPYGTVCPQTSNYCSASGQWIVDLDAAEAAAPGTVIGKPLDVLVHLSDGYGNIADQVHLAAAVRMEKKR